MSTIDQQLKALQEVNRDIEGMLKSGATTEKAQKILKEAREYRQMLEDDLLSDVRKQGKSNEPEIIGVIIINLN